MKTSVTMMYGIGETLAERIEHLERVREVQSRTDGFTAFICWPLQPENTPTMSHQPKTDAIDYLRTVAIARIVLDNVPNLQASWVTMGMKIGQIGASLRLQRLRLAHDRGERRVGSEHDAPHDDRRDGAFITDAGFTPARRRQDYSLIDPVARSRDPRGCRVTKARLSASASATTPTVSLRADL